MPSTGLQAQTQASAPGIYCLSWLPELNTAPLFPPGIWQSLKLHRKQFSLLCLLAGSVQLPLGSARSVGSEWVAGGQGLAGILFQQLWEAFSGQGRRPGEFKTWCLKYNGSLKHCIFPKGKGNGCQELRSSKLLRSWEREETSLGVAKADDEVRGFCDQWVTGWLGAGAMRWHLLCRKLTLGEMSLDHIIVGRVQVLELGDCRYIYIYIYIFEAQCSPDFNCNPYVIHSILRGLMGKDRRDQAPVMCVLSSVWLCSPMDCRLPGSPVHGILQARILERVVSPFSRGTSRHREGTGISASAGRCFTASITW